MTNSTGKRYAQPAVLSSRSVEYGTRLVSYKDPADDSNQGVLDNGDYFDTTTGKLVDVDNDGE